jgi:hypothetical protein
VILHGYPIRTAPVRRGPFETGVRWFCRLGLDDKGARPFDLDSNILRLLFEPVTQPACPRGLIGGKGFAVDASLIAADPNKQRSVKAGRAVREYWATLDDAAFGAVSETTPK